MSRGPCGEQFEENDAARVRKRSNRRQGIFLKLTELKHVTMDHVYMELYKRDEREGHHHKPNLLTKMVVCSSKELLRRREGNSNKENSVLEESSLTPEQVKNFDSPSRKRQIYIKRAIEKASTKNKSKHQVCQLCNESTNIPWLGCDFEGANGKMCEYWVHALCHGFPDAEDDTFENISFRCPPHNRANVVAASAKVKKSTGLWK